MKNLILASASIVAFALFNPHAAKAASFDCSMATTASENTICDNPKLSDLDTVLSAAFNQVIRQNPREERSIRNFAQTQLNRRNACYSNTRCIVRVQLDSIVFYRKLGATVSFPSWAE